MDRVLKVKIRDDEDDVKKDTPEFTSCENNQEAGHHTTHPN